MRRLLLLSAFIIASVVFAHPVSSQKKSVQKRSVQKSAKFSQSDPQSAPQSGLSANINFYDFFEDRTLRADYIFAGTSSHQSVYLDQLSSSPVWYGRTQRLGELAVEGNGQIEMTDAASGTVIYRTSFSTLFQEWITTPEAGYGNPAALGATSHRSFENVFLMPMPKAKARVKICLINNRRDTVAKLTHVVDPADILIRSIGDKYVTPHEVIHPAADSRQCINVAFVAEGYTAGQMDKFVSDARRAMDAILDYEPFKTYAHRFNFVAVKAVSRESGTSIPADKVWKNTALGSHFNTFYMDRYLTTLHLKSLHDVLAGVPYEHIIVLVNTDNYGGGGILNSYNLSMVNHPLFLPVVVHEFGHSFAGLADEYAYDTEEMDMYPRDVEPWEANITTGVDFASKWQKRMGEKTPQGEIGCIEGAGYHTKGCYRAMPSCRMRDNSHPDFCPICQEAIEKVILFYTGE